MNLTIDLSKNLCDLLRDVGIEDPDSLEQIEYGAVKEFVEKEKGKFLIGFVPEQNRKWIETIKKFGKFLRMRYHALDFRSPRLFLGNPFWNLVENAMVWGHGEDKEKEIGIGCYFSPKGFLLTVTDQGPGFDVKEVVAKMYKGEVYFKNGGSAFEYMERDQNNTYSFNDLGNEAYMLCPANHFAPRTDFKPSL